MDNEYDPREDYYTGVSRVTRPFVIDMRDSYSRHWTMFRYPDGQVSVNINVVPDKTKKTYLVWNGSMEELMLMVNAMESMDLIKDTLIIPYLMGARYDRVMHEGDAFYLKVMANVINSCGFRKVAILDPHSDVAMALINNAVKVDNSGLVSLYHIPDSVLICPDAGAAKHVDRYMKINKNLTDVVFCIKHRESGTGKISLKVLEPEKCHNKSCVVIDDLCDGGGTFAAIADQISPEHLTLIITHGLFTKGLTPLAKYNTIITTDSKVSKEDLNKIGLQTVVSATTLMGESFWI